MSQASLLPWFRQLNYSVVNKPSSQMRQYELFCVLNPLKNTTLAPKEVKENCGIEMGSFYRILPQNIFHLPLKPTSKHEQKGKLLRIACMKENLLGTLEWWILVVTPSTNTQIHKNTSINYCSCQQCDACETTVLSVHWGRTSVSATRLGFRQRSGI